MSRFRQICVVIFLAAFLSGNMAATAMAYCGAGHENISMTDTVDSAAHSRMAVMDNGDVDEVTQHHPSNGNGDASNCFDCDGTLCHGQTLVPVHSISGLYDSTVGLFLEQELNLTTIFLTRIPQPPEQLS